MCVCVCVPCYTSILIYTHTIYVCVGVPAGDYYREGVCVSACVSFTFAVYDSVCIITYYYAIDFCVNMYAFYAFL